MILDTFEILHGYILVGVDYRHNTMVALGF